MAPPAPRRSGPRSLRQRVRFFLPSLTILLYLYRSCLSSAPLRRSAARFVLGVSPRRSGAPARRVTAGEALRLPARRGPVRDRSRQRERTATAAHRQRGIDARAATQESPGLLAGSLARSASPSAAALARVTYGRPHESRSTEWESVSPERDSSCALGRDEGRKHTEKETRTVKVRRWYTENPPLVLSRWREMERDSRARMSRRANDSAG